MASVLTTWTDSGRPGLVAASESGSASLTVDEIISRSPRGKLFPQSRSLTHADAADDILQTWELIAIILSSAFITAAIVIVAVWYHRRKSSSKISDLNAPRHHGQLEAVVVVTSYEKTSDAATPVNIVSLQEAMNGDDESVYGSVVDSLPPSPTLSFRSVIEGPGLSRSRAGTGTSFGTVASLESVRSCRSHWSIADAEISAKRYEPQLP